MARVILWAIRWTMPGQFHATGPGNSAPRARAILWAILEPAPCGSTDARPAIWGQPQKRGTGGKVAVASWPFFCPGLVPFSVCHMPLFSWRKTGEQGYPVCPQHTTGPWQGQAPCNPPKRNKAGTAPDSHQTATGPLVCPLPGNLAPRQAKALQKRFVGQSTAKAQATQRRGRKFRKA